MVSSSDTLLVVSITCFISLERVKAFSGVGVAGFNWVWVGSYNGKAYR